MWDKICKLVYFFIKCSLLSILSASVYFIITVTLGSLKSLGLSAHISTSPQIKTGSQRNKI